MDSLIVHAFKIDLLSLVKFFKRGTKQILDHLNGVFSIVQCPQSEILLRAPLENFSNTNPKIMISVSGFLK